jgi:hypothetical protein
MSEDRLEKALQAMKDERATPQQVAEAGKRVQEKLGNPGDSLCAEFQSEMQGYLGGNLTASRRMLLEDHLGRCSPCRARLAELKGDRNVVAMHPRRTARWPKWGAWIAAAAVILLAGYIGRESLDSLLAPRGPRATVASLQGSLYQVPEGILKNGSAIGDNEVIRTAPGARAILQLHDGSLIDVNEGTELSVHAAWSGQSIRLERGDIVVRAAKRHRGYLRVETRDSIASVKGTIFAVSTGFGGSVVSVVEGAVAVTQPGSEVLLRPGQQAASNPAMASSVQNAVAWSPDAQTYLAVLASIAHIEKTVAALPSPMLRTQSVLLPLIPPQVAVYGAVPNLGSAIEQAISQAEQQSQGNPAFNQWWNSGAGADLKKLVSRLQTVTPLLGDELVWAISNNTGPAIQVVPFLMAEVRQGKRADLAAMLDELGTGTNEIFKYRLTDTLLLASNTSTNLEWLANNMSLGSRTPFAVEIAARYRDGAAWLLGVDMDSIIFSSGGTQNALINEQPLKYLFFEQRGSQGDEENEMAVSFKGPRTGLASILANSGSGGAAEYLSSDSILAIYAATREPQQLFDEIITQLSRLSPEFRKNLAEAETQMGISFSNDLVRAIGTESAFAVNGLSATGPSWTMSVVVNDASTLEATIGKLVNAVNAGLAKEGKTNRLILEQEVVNGRTWTLLKQPSAPMGATWTYDRGYMVAGSDRGVATQAIATRNGGSPLPWSPAFQQQLPPSAGLHPAGFAWINTRGALQGLSSLIPDPAIRNLISERDPVLVMVSGTMEQIRAVSRTRLSGMVMNMMLLQGMNRGRAASGAPTL